MLPSSVQVAFQSYKLSGEQLLKLSDFSVYIQPVKGVSLNRFVTQYTGIDEKLLAKEGIYLEMAKKQVIEYLLNFNFQDTILLGWDLMNDIMMFNRLFNYNEDMIDIGSFRWVDLSKVFTKLHNLPHSISLEKACEMYDFTDPDFHNATNDVVNTVKLLECLIDKFKVNKVLYETKETTVKKSIKKEKSIL